MDNFRFRSAVSGFSIQAFLGAPDRTLAEGASSPVLHPRRGNQRSGKIPVAMFTHCSNPLPRPNFWLTGFRRVRKGDGGSSTTLRFVLDIRDDKPYQLYSTGRGKDRGTVHLLLAVPCAPGRDCGWTFQYVRRRQSSPKQSDSPASVPRDVTPVISYRTSAPVASRAVGTWLSVGGRQSSGSLLIGGPRGLPLAVERAGVSARRPWPADWKVERSGHNMRSAA